MRVLLVRPNARYDSIVVPIGLGYLAAHIRERHEVSLLDCEARNMDVEGLADRVERFRPDVIGFQMYSSDRTVVRSYLTRLSRMAIRPVVVAGGPHPSSVPREVLDEFAPHIDYAFAGEAEIAFAKFLSAL